MALQFQGSSHFRQRIICATLSGKPIVITDIRASKATPGLQDFEGNFLKLIEKFTKGCTVEISNKGTTVKYTPGIIIGGTINHHCGKTRSIGYCLEGLLCLAPFAKTPTNATLRGITNDDTDASVDTLRTSILSVMTRFGVSVEEGLNIKVLARGAPPSGGGTVLFTCPIVKELTPMHLTDFGKVKRIRGIAYATRVSPQLANRLIDGARTILNSFTSDIYITADHRKAGQDAGGSPGYGITLLAETTTGCTLTAEKIGVGGSVPEDLGLLAANILLEEVLRGGCVDTSTQSLALLFMCLCPEDVSKVRLGPLSDYTIQFVRHLQDFFGVMFKIQPDAESKTVLFSCVGIGYKNLARKIT